jgi:hypothetical protein
MSADILQFFAHGGPLPDRPLQPPDLPPAPEPRDFTQAEKIDLIVRMCRHDKWRKRALEALPEADAFDWFVSALLTNADEAAGDWARDKLIRYFEGCLANDQEDWETYT